MPAEDIAIAEAAALEGLNAFVDTDQSAEDWWAQLEPLLSADGRYRFEGTDPELVPASEVTGDPELLSAAGWVLTFQIPTDVGTYSVDVVQQDDETEAQGGRWVVDYFHPPEDLL